jgi:hypothetical protein
MCSAHESPQSLPMSRRSSLAWPGWVLGLMLLHTPSAWAQVLHERPQSQYLLSGSTPAAFHLEALSLPGGGSLPGSLEALVGSGLAPMARFTLSPMHLLGEPLTHTALSLSELLTLDLPGSSEQWSELREALTRALGSAQLLGSNAAQQSRNGLMPVTTAEAILVAPTLMVAGNWWLAYRYRTEQDIATLYPLITVGLSLFGDLVPAQGPAGQQLAAR